MNETEYRLIPGGMTSDGWVVAEFETEERPQVRAVRCFRNRGEAQGFMEKLQSGRVLPSCRNGSINYFYHSRPG